MAEYVRVIDLTGKQFGRLSVLRRVENSPRREARWLCQCECGTQHVAVSRDLRIGDTTSCGCYFREVVNVACLTHGYSRSMTVGIRPEYQSWANMIQRCTNPRNDTTGNYYHKGITVCKHWRKFENFIADMGVCPPSYTIERKNGKKGYSPSNCIWASAKVQANNTSRNTYLEWVKERKTMAQWAEDPRCVVSYTALRSRNRLGWKMPNAILIPNRPRAKYTYQGETKTLTEWADDPRCPVGFEALRGRTRLGWNFHEAMTVTGEHIGKRRKRTK